MNYCIDLQHVQTNIILNLKETAVTLPLIAQVWWLQQTLPAGIASVDLLTERSKQYKLKLRLSQPIIEILF